MKFIPIRDLRTRAGKVWESLRREDELVLTSNGQPIALVTRVTGENLESGLKALRRARAFMALERIHQAASEKGVAGMSQEDVEKEIHAARQERSGHRSKSRTRKGKL